MLNNNSCLNIFILFSIYKALRRTHILFHVTPFRLEVLGVGNVEKSKTNILRTISIIRESVTYFCIFYNIIHVSLNDRTDNGKLIEDDVEGRRPRPTLRLCPNICLEQAWSVFCVVLTTTTKFGRHASNKKFNTLNEKWISIGIIMYTSLPVYYFIQYVKHKI